MVRSLIMIKGKAMTLIRHGVEGRYHRVDFSFIPSAARED
jgi:hypothetical protein